MDSKVYSGLSLQQFEVFLIAAKYENFARAAEELHMTTASVSRNISALEMTLGLILFVRHKQRVRLTNAGLQFAEDLRSLERQFDAILKKSFELQKCQYEVLRIGDCNVVSSSLYLLPALEKFEAAYPEIDTTISRTEPEVLLDGLLENQFDLIFVPSVGRDWAKAKHISFVPVIPQRPCIVISKKHRLYEKADPMPDDFSGETVVAMSKGFYSVYWDSVKSVMKQLHFSVDKVKFVENPHTMATELLRGQSIAFMDVVFTEVEKDSFRYIELSLCEPIWGISAAFSAKSPNPHLHKFIDCIKKSVM